MYMYVTPYDDDLFLENGGTHNRTEYLADKSNYGKYDWRIKLDPSASWPVSFVTGHKYKIHWGTGLDFEQMKFMMSEMWVPEDKSIYLVHNWTDVRAAIDVKRQVGSG